MSVNTRDPSEISKKYLRALISHKTNAVLSNMCYYLFIFLF